jgi:uncharacterized protein YaaN involved in tellurite resistance
VREKAQDLTTQLAVGVQGYMALDATRRSNVEMIRGAGRATSTTLSALRTAVTVAQAVWDQKLVLDQIAALNTTPPAPTGSASVPPRRQSGAVNNRAATSPPVELQKLQLAFNSIYAALDEIDKYKAKALDSINKTESWLRRVPPCRWPLRAGSGPRGSWQPTSR